MLQLALAMLLVPDIGSADHYVFQISRPKSDATSAHQGDDFVSSDFLPVLDLDRSGIDIVRCAGWRKLTRAPWPCMQNLLQVVSRHMLIMRKISSLTVLQRCDSWLKKTVVIRP